MVVVCLEERSEVEKYDLYYRMWLLFTKHLLVRPPIDTTDSLFNLVYNYDLSARDDRNFTGLPSQDVF